jgi:hypothetical protein
MTSMSKLVVLISFLVAFAAGLAVGVKWLPRSEPASNPTSATRPAEHRSWLASQLELTPAQQTQMNKIWSELPRRWRDRGDRQFFRERDLAVAALVGAENKVKYDEIRRQLFEQWAALDRDHKEARQRALDQSNEAIAALIGSENRPRYEEIQKRLADQLAGLERERQESREAWQHAVEQTKILLNAPQREKYEAILKNQPSGGPPPGGPRSGRDRRPWTREHGRSGGDRATSQPASAPQSQS